jgi:4-amino-4-deoxy-L-arabinose transferase-like glycosyltransferase
MTILNRSTTFLMVILTTSVLLRIAASFYLGNQIIDMPAISDQISYHTLALRLLEGNGFSFEIPWWPATRAGAPTAHWSYLYTAYLAAVYFIFGPNPLAARLIQAVLVGLMQPLLVFLIARRVFNPSVGLIAAGLTAGYTYFIYFAAALLTEPFFITAILLSLYLSMLVVDRLRSEETHPSSGSPTMLGNRSLLLLALAFGVSLAAAVLLRQVYLLFIPFLFTLMWWYSGRRAVPLLAISGLVLLASILPFTYYNQQRFDHFVLLNTNAGFAFFWANHPVYAHQFESILESSSYLSLIPVEFHQMNEAELDSALLKEGLQFVIDDPIRYARLSLSRLPALFMFWPASESGFRSNFFRATSFGLIWPFMLYGLLAVLSHLKKAASTKRFTILLLMVFVLFYTMLHLLSWALIRYRMPIDAVLIIFASFALVDLAARFKFRLKGYKFVQPGGGD